MVFGKMQKKRLGISKYYTYSAFTLRSYHSTISNRSTKLGTDGYLDPACERKSHERRHMWPLKTT